MLYITISLSTLNLATKALASYLLNSFSIFNRHYCLKKNGSCQQPGQDLSFSSMYTIVIIYRCSSGMLGTC